MDSTKAVVTKPPRRFRKWLAIPVLLLVVVLVFLGWAYVRGTWGEKSPYIPMTSEEGVVAHLLEVADGRKPIHVATVVDFPLEDTWAVVTDYAHFPEIFPYVKSAQATEEGKRRYHLTGTVSTPVGDWPLDVHIKHEEYLEDCQALWDERSGPFPLNRGSWLLQSMGPERTLVIYELELEAPPYPAFLVRAVLLSRLKPVVAAVNKRLQAQRAAKGG